ncbi:hypothetical protein [Methanoregula sp.]
MEDGTGVMISMAIQDLVQEMKTMNGKLEDLGAIRNSLNEIRDVLKK